MLMVMMMMMPMVEAIVAKFLLKQQSDQRGGADRRTDGWSNRRQTKWDTETGTDRQT